MKNRKKDQSLLYDQKEFFKKLKEQSPKLSREERRKRKKDHQRSIDCINKEMEEISRHYNSMNAGSLRRAANFFFPSNF